MALRPGSAPSFYAVAVVVNARARIRELRSGALSYSDGLLQPMAE